MYNISKRLALCSLIASVIWVVISLSATISGLVIGNFAMAGISFVSFCYTVFYLFVLFSGENYNLLVEEDISDPDEIEVL